MKVLLMNDNTPLVNLTMTDWEHKKLQSHHPFFVLPWQATELLLTSNVTVTKTLIFSQLGKYNLIRAACNFETQIIIDIMI